MQNPFKISLDKISMVYKIGFRHDVVNVDALDTEMNKYDYYMKEQFNSTRYGTYQRNYTYIYATAMMLARVNPKIVSEALGHSGIGITLDLYSHPDVSMQQQLLDVITEKRT